MCESDVLMEGGWGDTTQQGHIGEWVSHSAFVEGGQSSRAPRDNAAQATIRGPAGWRCPPAGIVMWVVTPAGCVMQRGRYRGAPVPQG